MDAVNTMKVWDQVCKTDPDMTERINFGAFKFTTIDSMYQIQQATQLFGPCGLGWGIRNQSFDMLVIDPSDPHYNLLCFTGQFWYVLDGKEGVYDIAADIELFEYSSKKQDWNRTGDPMKKVRTAGLSKALSWLGFSADVFLGKFDDARYVNQLQEEKKQMHAAASRRPAGQQLEGLAAQEQKDALMKLIKLADWNSEQVNIHLNERGTSWGKLTHDQAVAFLAYFDKTSKLQG